jgi:ubiquinone/menaquinone biosynthesis C-methylase UbiE
MASFEHDTRELAQKYDRVSDSQFEAGKRLVERLDVGAGTTLLDVGCGTGRLARWIAERGASVTGIDPLAERVEIARANVPNVRFEVGQAEDLSAFSAESFDVVCMSAVLHWVADKKKALSEVRRVLRPGGRLGVTTLPVELRDTGTVARLLAPILMSDAFAPHVDLSKIAFARQGAATTTDLIYLVLNADLEMRELHVGERTRTLPTSEVVIDFLDASSFGNFLQIVPAELRPRLRTELGAKLDELKTESGIELRDWGTLFVAQRR